MKNYLIREKNKSKKRNDINDEEDKPYSKIRDKKKSKDNRAKLKRQLLDILRDYYNNENK